jgi:hypothetical protein
LSGLLRVNLKIRQNAICKNPLINTYDKKIHVSSEKPNCYARRGGNGNHSSVGGHIWGVQSRVYRIRGPSAKGHNALGIGRRPPTLRHRYPYIDDIVPKTVCSRKTVLTCVHCRESCSWFRSEPPCGVLSPKRRIARLLYKRSPTRASAHGDLLWLFRVSLNSCVSACSLYLDEQRTTAYTRTTHWVLDKSSKS